MYAFHQALSTLPFAILGIVFPILICYNSIIKPNGVKDVIKTIIRIKKVSSKK